MYSEISTHQNAAGRIVSAALMIDGWVGTDERGALIECGVLDKLGLDLDSFERIFEAFCAETGEVECDEPCLRPRVTGDRVDDLLAEVSDPALQQTLLEAMVAIAYADGFMSRDERALIERARLAWGRPPQTSN
ncbi:MAG: TerB family tellurite resistance protein [Rhodocyclaceae bacterium]